MDSISRRIKAMRTLKEYTQQDMATKLGMTRTGYRKLEARGIKLTIEQVVKLSAILEVEVSDIIANEVSAVANNAVKLFKPSTLSPSVEDKNELGYIELLKKELNSRQDLINSLFNVCFTDFLRYLKLGEIVSYDKNQNKIETLDFKTIDESDFFSTELRVTDTSLERFWRYELTEDEKEKIFQIIILPSSSGPELSFRGAILKAILKSNTLSGNLVELQEDFKFWMNQFNKLTRKYQ